MLTERLAHDVRSRREHRVDLGDRRTGHLADDVSWDGRVHRDVGGLGLGVVDDGGQRLVVHDDQLGRVLSEIAARRDDEGHRVADEADLVVCERRPRDFGNVRTERRVPLLPDVGVQVGTEEHRMHPRHRECLARLDRLDAGSGDGAAHETGVQHPRARHVIDERPAARQQARILHPADAGTRVATSGGR